jgi:hypothetical protein
MNAQELIDTADTAIEAQCDGPTLSPRVEVVRGELTNPARILPRTSAPTNAPSRIIATDHDENQS